MGRKNSSWQFLEDTQEQQAFNTLIKKIRDNFCTPKKQFDGISVSELERLRNRYSHFVDTFSGGFLVRSALMIDKLNLPKGWFHYFFNLKWEIRTIAVSVVAQDGAGVLSLDSLVFGSISKLNTNENYMHVSQVYRNTRNVWVKNEKGQAYPLNPQPNFYDSTGRLEAEKYGTFSCEQAPGYIVIRSSRDGFEFRYRIFVPESLPGEIWSISVKNRSGRKRSVHIYPEVNFGLDSHPSHYFVGMAVSEVDYYPEEYAIVAKNMDVKNSFPRWGAFISGEEPLSFESSGDLYYGFGASVIYPPAIFKTELSNVEAKQPLKGMIGVFQYEIELGPDEEKEIPLALTAINPEIEINRQINAWKEILDKAQIETEFEKVKKSWGHIFESYLIKTPSDEIDRTFNVWGKYQSTLCSRFNSPYDVGTRDIFQYLLANCMFEPEYVRLMVPYLLSYQYCNGKIPRQISKFSNLHDLRNFMDCQLWMHDLVGLYIKETGDFDFLDEEVGFLEDDHKTRSNQDRKSVYQHLLLAIKSAYDGNVGRHGLCKLGYGGWNDALDGLKGDNSESVWLSQLLVYASREMRELAEWKKDQDTLQYLDAIIHGMTETINVSGWDQDGYYIFGYNNDGLPVGSSSNDEGKKHLNENSWAILSGVAPRERIGPMIAAMKELKTPFGPRLLVPYSKKSSKEVGRIADQAAGHFENGAVYQHGVMFWATALLNFDVDEAYENFILLTNENRIPDISSNPGIYHSNYTAVPLNSDYGKEPYYPFTGSHTWRMMFLVEMLGIKVGLTHLCIDPKVPSNWMTRVNNGELIFKARKISNRKEHHNLFFNMEVYRDDSLAPDTKKVLIDGSVLNPVNDQFMLELISPVFRNESEEIKIIEIKVYLSGFTTDSHREG